MEASLMEDNFEKLGDIAAGIVASLKPPRSVPPFGLHDDIDAARYHADEFFDEPTLSSGIAGKLLNETPKHARQAHPRLGGLVAKKATREMDLGSVAHEIVLGKGGGYVVSPYDEFRTKEAKAWRDETIESGATPIKDKDFRAAEQMAKSLRAVLAETPDAEDAFMMGRAEAVLLWRDIGGPICRAMLDFWDQPFVYDLKTTGNGLSDRALRTWIASGLDLQAAFYMRGLETAIPHLAGRVKWRWCFLETEEPFEARVIEMDAATRTFGDRKAALAIEKWRRCLAANDWPGYAREIGRIEYAAWAENNIIAREMEDPDAVNMRPVFAPAPTTRSDQLEEFAP
jgi:PDDEXK-like uncharacterized protein DUF3799